VTRVRTTQTFTVFLALGALASGVLLTPAVAEACGGVTAYIADRPEAVKGAKQEKLGGTVYYVLRDGSLALPVSEVKISSELAEVIARRYLDRKYGRYEHFEFEAFTFEHGDFVYMYHARVPGLAVSYHVGPVRFATDEAHIHISATTGFVYGFGCGGGPGDEDMAFDPSAYPPDLAAKRLPYRQFDSHAVVRDGRMPTIDGRIGYDEWADAAHLVVLVGTAKAEVEEYG
jgi:hypothetical protein